MTDQREVLLRAVDAIRLGYHGGALLRDPSPEFDDWLRQCSLAMRELLHIADALAALPSTPQPEGLDAAESSRQPDPIPTTPLGWALLMVGSFTVKDDSGNLCTMILGDRDNVARRMEAWLAQHPTEAARLAPPLPEHVHTPTSKPGDLNAWCSTCGYFPLPLAAPPPPEPTE